MAPRTELEDLRDAIAALRDSNRGTPAYADAVDRLDAACKRAAARLRTGEVGADERAQLLKLVADGVGVIGRAFGGGTEA